MLIFERCLPLFGPYPVYITGFEDFIPNVLANLVFIPEKDLYNST